MRLFFKVFILSGFLAMPAVQSFALDIQFVDKNNQAIPNLVVSLPHSQADIQSKVDELAIMDQVDYQFKPIVLIVDKSQWVDFPNSDDVRHHVYSFSSPKTFQIKLFSGSEAKPVQFPEPGVVVLGCNIHDSMVGYIYVRDQEYTAKTDASGIAQLKDDWFDASLPKQQQVIHVWHPDLSANSAERQTITLDTSQQNIQKQQDKYVVTLSIQGTKQAQKQPSKGFGSKFGRH